MVIVHTAIKNTGRIRDDPLKLLQLNTVTNTGVVVLVKL